MLADHVAFNVLVKAEQETEKLIQSLRYTKNYW